MDAETAQRLADLERRLGRLESIQQPGLPKAWTPTYVGLSTPGTTTYIEQTGFYVRTGALIVAQGIVRWSAATGTGDAVISLPVTSGNYTNFPVAIYLNFVTFGALTPFGLLQPNAAGFRIFTPVNNGASVAVSVEAAGEISFLAVYFP